MTSQTISRLQAGRTTAWPSLIPVIDWAIHEAREAEYRASVASDQALAGISPTKVSAFDLKPTSLTLTITRDGHDTYTRKQPTPRVGDIPPDYLAAINAWIAGGLR